MVGRSGRGRARVLLVRQVPDVPRPRRGDLARGGPAGRPSAHPGPARRRLPRAAAGGRRRRADRPAPRPGGSPARRGRGQLAGGGDPRRGQRPEPGHPGAAGDGEVADDHEPDRRGGRPRAGGSCSSPRRWPRWRSSSGGSTPSAWAAPCLELHSHKTSKKAVLEQLRRTLELGRPKLGAVDADFRLLADARDRLNAYAEAVNEPVGPGGVDPHRAFGELIRLRRRIPRDPARVRPPRTRSLDGLRLPAAAGGLSSSWRPAWPHAGVPRDHPFWGSSPDPAAADGGGPAGGPDPRRPAPPWPPSATPPRAWPAPSACPGRSRRRRPRRCRGPRGWWWSRPGGGRPTSGPRNGTPGRGEVDELLAAGATLADLRRRFEARLLPDAWDRDVAEVAPRPERPRSALVAARRRELPPRPGGPGRPLPGGAARVARRPARTPRRDPLGPPLPRGPARP